MNLEIGYLPKKYYSQNQPNAGGFFPFVVEGDIKYVVDFSFGELDDKRDDFIEKWMKNLSVLPLYFCVEIFDFDREDFELYCHDLNISYEYMGEKSETIVCLSKIENEKQLQKMLPFLVGAGLALNSLIVWSENKNKFRMNKREWAGNLKGSIQNAVIVNMEVDSTVFWLSYDGDGIMAISNERRFQTEEEVIKNLPEFVVPSFIEFEE